MANETLTDVFSDIADAVRAKGVTGQMTPLQMPAKITSIPSGSGSKYGVGASAFLGDVDANGALQPPSASYTFSFSSSDIVSIGNNLLKEKFKGTGITQVDLPNLTTIGNGGLKSAFQDCTSLTTVNMPSVTNVSGGNSDLASFYQCFSGCTSLTTVKLNKNNTFNSLPSYVFYLAFQNCSSLTNLEFPQITGNVNSYAFGGAFSGCSSLTDADFFSGVTQAWASAFSGTFRDCTSLTEVDFSNLTTLQGYYCLDSVCSGCTSLKNAYFTKLSNTGNGWNYGFSNCTSLELVDFHLATAIPAISTTLFDNTNNTFKIVVPNALYSQWKTATNWSTYADHIVMADPGVMFKATQANSTIQLTQVGNPSPVSLEYKTTGSWTPYTIGDTIILANVGDQVYFRATSGANNKFGTDASNYHQFVMTGEIEASNPITFLLNQNGTDSTLVDNSYLFYKLFSGCSALTKAPELPEATMDESCYAYMFQGTSIEKTPKMPVATLDVDCYKGMFQDNTTLTAATLEDTTMANGCYDAMFKGCSSLTEITTKYVGNFSTTYFNDWVDGVAASGTFYYSGSDTTQGASAIPTGWTVIAYGGLTITAREANSTVSMTKDSGTPSVTLEYSTDATTWNPFVIGTTTVTLSNIGDKVYFRAGQNGNTSFTTRYSSQSHKFVMTGSVDLSGNLNSIFSRDYDSVTTINADGSGGIGNLFTDCSAIVDASKLLMKATTIGDFTYNHTFYRCTNMTKAPVIYATSIGSRYSLGDIFNGCSSLSEIKIYYTGTFGGEKTSNWVNGVPATGTFYYNGSDTQRGASYIPTGWTITTFTP